MFALCAINGFVPLINHNALLDDHYLCHHRPTVQRDRSSVAQTTDMAVVSPVVSLCNNHTSVYSAAVLY